eukprot:TRINITY_DN11272_c0_g1_i5.p2 TRINITY_DN11272_c0_g1~~TRINITY_DN11272_c0_g1_i5.p2  ORF type:complete len:240 (-),score=26.11 TRINITY_DN11272_c0_g1_i5:70-789(-)
MQAAATYNYDDFIVCICNFKYNYNIQKKYLNQVYLPLRMYNMNTRFQKKMNTQLQLTSNSNSDIKQYHNKLTNSCIQAIYQCNSCRQYQNYSKILFHFDVQIIKKKIEGTTQYQISLIHAIIYQIYKQSTNVILVNILNNFDFFFFFLINKMENCWVGEEGCSLCRFWWVSLLLKKKNNILYFCKKKKLQNFKNIYILKKKKKKKIIFYYQKKKKKKKQYFIIKKKKKKKRKKKQQKDK